MDDERTDDDDEPDDGHGAGDAGEAADGQDSDDADQTDDAGEAEESVEDEFAKAWMSAMGEAPDDAYYVSRACGCVEFYSAGVPWHPCSDHPGVTVWDRLV